MPATTSNNPTIKAGDGQLNSATSRLVHAWHKDPTHGPCNRDVTVKGQNVTQLLKAIIKPLIDSRRGLNLTWPGELYSLLNWELMNVRLWASHWPQEQCMSCGKHLQSALFWFGSVETKQTSCFWMGFAKQTGWRANTLAPLPPPAPRSDQINIVSWIKKGSPTQRRFCPALVALKIKYT